ncbi:M48 family metallopeptidase [Arenicella xantha]|uniref:Zn-dependent protease with chaperone function n=1 Tax=Arenicella xantha TaxID=644221 RepID=A0A395JQZ7_9GAMM|nr:M48 family metallopeptidase [Arenicella xantha]RBP53793.1 Zn-dependent protease with chaperone function [Arenicella xantha]
MNFFEHQARARKQSRWIIIAFIVVTLLIVLAIDLIVMAVFAVQAPVADGVNYVSQGAFSQFTNPDAWIANSGILLISSGATAGLIGLASLGKIASLRSGGGKVARDMGATIVTADTRDPLRRRLYNVVEEISLASGAPVPEVYVMENEPGINAFAAGYTAADAAVAVTQGALEKLSRSELQGVIAHEFSHIFNGDMRINIRMMGIIFGITVIAIAGRKFLHATSFRRSSSRDNNAGAVVAIGLGLMVVGYIGLFFARWMKSALSRQREYLADASAVQFTRDPSSIAGALKKIAAYSHSSYLKGDAEEVSHMLFGSGYRQFMFATHPPLEKRIERIEKRFDPSEITALAAKLRSNEHREHEEATIAAQEQQRKAEKKKSGGIFDIENIISNIGNPDVERIAAAAMLTASISDGLSSAAHSLEWAPEVMLYCLLDNDQALRDQQLMIVIEKMGDISEQKLQHLLTAHGTVRADQRLPLLEICFPSLKRRPFTDVEKLLATVDLMASVDNRIDSFEYLLSRLIKQYMHEANIPSKTRLHGSKKLSSCVGELTTVVSVVAAHGQNSQSAAGLQAAQKAFRAGMAVADINHTNLSFTDNWHEEVDKAIDKLDNLTSKDKSTVVAVLVRTVLDDRKIITEEHEMLRVLCSLIHVPLPILNEVASV